jgi:hypothetical protein
MRWRLKIQLECSTRLNDIILNILFAIRAFISVQSNSANSALGVLIILSAQSFNANA